MGTADGRQFSDLVFEGGGVKGIGLAGAFAALEERGFAPKNVAGTSAGAIAAALVAVGYSSAQLGEILRTIPFAKLRDKGPEDKLPLLGPGLSVLLEMGIYEGRFLELWMAELLEAKGITRFGQLADSGADSPQNRYRLRVIVSDVTHRRMLVLPDDAGHLGVDPDELEISYAVRMSMSVPFFFEPVVHANPQTGEDHLIVDGGVLSNFPVWLFDREGGDPRWPTFGLLLVEPDPKVGIGHRLARDEQDAKPGSLVDYVRSLAYTVLEGRDRFYVEKATYARTIPIPTLGVATTEFDITPERARALYESGHKAANDFLDNWDFTAYVEEFRRGKEHSRRRDLLATLRRREE